MVNITALNSFAAVATDRESTDILVASAQMQELDLGDLARRLSSEFPLHSASELRRTLAEAKQDLWPHQDPIDIVDRARERLHEGLAG